MQTSRRSFIEVLSVGTAFALLPGTALVSFSAGKPRVITQKVTRFVDIETRGELTLGEMAIDEPGVWGKPPNATICVEASEAMFKKMVFDTLNMS